MRTSVFRGVYTFGGGQRLCACGAKILILCLYAFFVTVDRRCCTSKMLSDGNVTQIAVSDAIESSEIF